MADRLAGAPARCGREAQRRASGENKREMMDGPYVPREWPVHQSRQTASHSSVHRKREEPCRASFPASAPRVLAFLYFFLLILPSAVRPSYQRWQRQRRRQRLASRGCHRVRVDAGLWSAVRLVRFGRPSSCAWSCRRCVDHNPMPGFRGRGHWTERTIKLHRMRTLPARSGIGVMRCMACMEDTGRERERELRSHGGSGLRRPGPWPWVVGSSSSGRPFSHVCPSAASGRRGEFESGAGWAGPGLYAYAGAHRVHR